MVDLAIRLGPNFCWLRSPRYSAWSFERVLKKSVACRILVLGSLATAWTALRAAEPSKDLDRVRRQLAQTRQEIEQYQSEEEGLQKSCPRFKAARGRPARSSAESMEPL